MPKTSYDAFMSYSHGTDRDLAPVLQNLVTRVGQPFYRRSSLRVFRDTTSLTMTEDLWGGIASALASARFFILMASPAAARSEWVQREIDFWVRNRSPRTFFIVLTAGEIVWDDTSGDFDWDRTTALPRTLSGWFEAEPLWEDVTSARGRTRRGQRNVRLREAARTLAAPLRGVSKEELDGADERESRRGRRFLQGSVAGLLALTTATGVTAAYAVGQRDEAVSQLRTATSRALAAESANVADRDPVLSARLALLADEVQPSAQTAAALMSAVDRNRYVAGYLEQSSGTTTGRDADTGLENVSHVAVSADGSTAVGVSSYDGAVRVWDTATRELRGTLTNTGDADGAASPDLVFLTDRRLAVLFQGHADVWDLGELRQLSSTSVPVGSTAAISDDGRFLAVTDPDRPFEQWAVHDLLAPGGPALAFRGDAVTAEQSVTGARSVHAVFPRHPRDYADTTLDGATAAVLLLGNTTVELWDLSAPRRLAQHIFSGEAGITAVAAAGDGKSVVVGTDGGELLRLGADLADPQVVARLPAGVAHIDLDADGGTGIAVDDNGTTVLLHLDHDSRFDVIDGVRGIPDEFGDIEQPGLVTGGERWLVLTRDATVQLWEAGSGRLIGEVPAARADSGQFVGVDRVAFTEDGGRMAVIDGHRVVTYELPALTELGAVDAADPLAKAQALHDATGRIQTVQTHDDTASRVWAVSGTGPRLLAELPESTDRGLSLYPTATGAVVEIHVVTEPGERTLTAYDLTGDEPVELGTAHRAGSFSGTTVGGRGRFVALEWSVLDILTGSEVPLGGGDDAFPDRGASVLRDDGVLVRNTTPTRNASGTLRNTLLVWDASAGSLVGQWADPLPMAVVGAQQTQIVPVGTERIASVRADGSVALWRIGRDVWTRQLCALVGDLNDPDRARYLGAVDAPRRCA